MRRGLIITSILVLLIFVVSCTPQTPEISEPTTDLPAEEEQVMEEKVADQVEGDSMEEPVEDVPLEISDKIVKITSSGFEPRTLNVNIGATVTFVNEDSNKHWPASAVHPTHTIYPGSGINKCGSGEKIFDACKGLAQGESFSFTFDEEGSWNYHDHLRPSNTGTIVVE